jgi:hypothetical protein
LAAEAQLKTQYEQFLLEQPAVLTEAERLAIQNLAQDIPALWQADTTTAIDRQMIVRQLIERIVVNVVDSSEAVQVEVHWQGGHITQTLINLKTAVEYIPANKNQHKLDKVNWVM